MSINQYYIYVNLIEAVACKKIMPSANTLNVPVALHSTLSAMNLLHTILLAYLITR